MVGSTQSGGGRKGVGGQLEGLCMEKCWGNMSKPPYSFSFLLSESHRQMMGGATLRHEHRLLSVLLDREKEPVRISRLVKRTEENEASHSGYKNKRSLGYSGSGI